jgi:hypothetical protein
MLFHLIIKVLSATTDGFGRESTDRIATRNNQSDYLHTSDYGRFAEYPLQYRATGVLPELPEQICTYKMLIELSPQICCLP